MGNLQRGHGMFGSQRHAVYFHRDGLRFYMHHYITLCTRINND
jgi:hypothetical protein